jgi:uncharacterized membrane protein YraQ (UPF0718 family)
MFEFVPSLLVQSVGKVWETLAHNWPFLLVSVVMAAWLRRSLDADRVAAFLRNHRRTGVVAATAAAVATPFCSCGTTAVILGMVAGLMPWAPIVAFMVASPLTSPQELVYSAGLFGWPFAIAFFVTSILVGLAGGLIAGLLENAGWLANQARFQAAAGRVESARCAACEAPRVTAGAGAVCGCPAAESLPAPVSLALPVLASGGCCAAAPQAIRPGPALPAAADFVRVIENRWLPFLREVATTGGRLLAQFLGFAFLGYFVNGLIPAGWVSALFGGGHVYSVPLAATLGLPFYLNTESSLPLVRTLLDSGMSQGAALAFMVAGSGTSIGALAGALTIARWRVVALVVLVLWAGAMACGIGYDALLPFIS